MHIYILRRKFFYLLRLDALRWLRVSYWKQLPRLRSLPPLIALTHSSQQSLERRRRQQNARLLKSQQKRIMSLNLFYDSIVNNKFMSPLNNRLASLLSDTLDCCSGLYCSQLFFFRDLVCVLACNLFLVTKSFVA